MKGGGPILWNTIAVCETSKTSWEMGQHVWKSTRRIIQRDKNTVWSTNFNTIRFLQKTNQEFINWQESIIRSISWLWADRGRIWKGDILKADLEDLEKLYASDIILEESTRKKYWSDKKDDEFMFPFADGTEKIVRKRLRIPRVQSKAGTNRKEREFQQRTSWWTRRWCWSPYRFGLIQGDFIYRHHNGPWVQLCRRKTHSLFHWNILMLLGWSGSATRETNWR